MRVSSRAAAFAIDRRRLRVGVDEAAEDHLAGGRLQHAGDDDVDRLADHRPRVVDDHHRAVVEIGDTLVVFLAFLQDEHLHRLAGQHDRLQRVGELVDVEHFDAAQLGDLVEVEVVGDDLALQRARELDELEIDFLDVGKIGVRDDDVEAGHLLDALQDVEAAAAAVAAQRIGRIGDLLQLLQHELRHDERAVDESGLADVGDAAVDDDAGVENSVAALRLRSRPEQAGEPLGLEPLARFRAEHEADVRQREQDERVEEDDAEVVGVRPEMRVADQPREQQSDGAADERADDVGERRLPKAIFEEDDEAGDARRRTRRWGAVPQPSGRSTTAQYAITATNATRARAPHLIGPSL